jgi:hypothetical protein
MDSTRRQLLKGIGVSGTGIFLNRRARAQVSSSDKTALLVGGSKENKKAEEADINGYMQNESAPPF